MNEVGAVGVPVGAAIGAANRVGVQGARAMQESARPITRFTGRALESAAVNPAKFAAKEGVYAVGAGTGSGVAREMVSDNDPTTDTGAELTADILGALAGGGGVAAGQYVSRGARDMGAAVARPEAFATDQARAEAAATLGRAYGSPQVPSGAMDTSQLSTALRTGPRVGNTIPGYKDSVSDVTQDPGLAALEFSRQNSGDGAGVFAVRRQDNQRAADTALSDAAPTASPGAFSDAARTRRTDIATQIEDYLDQLNLDLGQTTEGLSPSMTSEARGQTVRGALDEALGQARSAEREAWSAVSGQADPAPLAYAFDRLYGNLTQSERRVVDDARAAIDTPGSLGGAPGSGDDMLSAILGPDGRPYPRPQAPVSEMTRLEEITSLRSEFTSAQRAAEAAGDPNKSRILGQFVAAIDTYLDTAPDVAEPLRAARAVSKDLNDRFTRRGDPVADSLATRPSGGPAVPDSNVPGRFVQPDTRDAASIDRLLAEADSDEVRSALQDQILDTVRSRGLLDSPDRLDAFLGQYSRVFEKFPELKQSFGTAAGLKREIASTETGQRAMQRDLFSASGNAVGRYLQYGDERAKDAMNTVLRSKDPAAAMDELLSFVDDTPQAVEGARAAFWDALKGKAQSTGTSTRTGGGGQSWRYQDVFNFVNEPGNAAAMERLYRDDPEHLGHLRELASALSGANFGTTGRAAGSSGTPQGVFAGSLPSAESVGSRVFAVNRGVVSPQFAAFNLGSVMARKIARGTYSEQFNRILDQALLDPDVAEKLTREYNPANVAALARWAKGWGIAEAPEIAALLAEDLPESEDDQMQEAIGRPGPLRMELTDPENRRRESR